MPYGHVVKLLTALVCAVNPALIHHGLAAPRTMIFFDVGWFIEKYILRAVCPDRVGKAGKRAAPAVNLPLVYVTMFNNSPHYFAAPPRPPVGRSIPTIPGFHGLE